MCSDCSSRARIEAPATRNAGPPPPSAPSGSNRPPGLIQSLNTEGVRLNSPLLPISSKAVRGAMAVRLRWLAAVRWRWGGGCAAAAALAQCSRRAAPAGRCGWALGAAETAWAARREPSSMRTQVVGGMCAHLEARCEWRSEKW